MKATAQVCLLLCVSAATAMPQCTLQQQQAREPATNTGESKNPRESELQARLEALERRFAQLEKRVDDALPGAPVTPGATVTGPIDALESKVRRLEQLQANEVKEKPTANPPTARETFSLRSADGMFRLRIGGHLQVDGKTFYDDVSHLATDSFDIRRARPIMEGSLGKYFDFRIMPDFGGGASTLYDAYADLKFSPWFVLRGGKFKTPIGLEQLQNDADLTFMERSLVTDLVPNRDIGFGIYGNLRDRVAYQIAVLNGAPDGTNIDGDNNDGKDVAGRIFFTPFRGTLLKGVGFGIAAGSGRQDGINFRLPSYKTTGGLVPFFSYTAGTFPSGRRLHYSPQVYYYNGPLSFIAEYAESAQYVSATVAKSLIRREIANHAWQVTGSWVLTGEQKSYRGVIPRNAVEPGKFPLRRGAWELAARYSELQVDPNAFTFQFADAGKSARAARAWTIGLNWYLSYFVKIQLNYEQTRFQNGTANGTVLSNRPTEKTFGQRLQFAF